MNSEQRVEQIGEIYQNKAPQLTAFTNSKLHNSFVAEDIVQDYFLKLLEANQQPEHTEPPCDSYLYRGVLFKLVDFTRRESKLNTTPLTPTVNQMNGNIEYDQLNQSMVSNPDNLIDNEVMENELMNAIVEYANLTAVEVKILNLSLENKSQKEIADEMGITSLGTVKAKVHRIKAKARNAATYYLLRSGFEVAEVSIMTGQSEESIFESCDAVEATLRKRAQNIHLDF